MYEEHRREIGDSNLGTVPGMDFVRQCGTVHCPVICLFIKMSSDSFHDAYWLLAVVPVGCSVQVQYRNRENHVGTTLFFAIFQVFIFFSCAIQQEKNDSPPILIFV